MSRINEESPTVNAGAGHIAGIGVGDKGEPGRSKSKLLRRSKFAGSDVFVVDTKRFMKARMGKRRFARYEEYVGNDEIGEAIREYGRSNRKPIIIQDEQTGAMMYLRYGSKR